MTDVVARLANLSAEQRAQLAARLGQIPPRAAPDAIAIIGVGCRFPGGAVSPEAFWERLLAGMDAIGKIPVDRWNVDITPELSRWGAFLDDIDQFDGDFFGLSPRETARMDPQQRLLLETTWEALEDAGQMTEALAGSATGVFIGAHSHSSDYFLLQAAMASGLDTYTATGSAHSILANRLSFVLDLRGPSLAIDAACSSSLVAVHMACQSLRSGEADMALAGGVNLMLAPDFYGCLSQMDMLAPDGRCKTFDHRANGFVRGEGCGVVVLKRLADAQRDGDPVLALILGSAVNQDGASNGLTAPNGLAQQAVIRRALQMAQVGPDEVNYVETHGTGTALGDPIEVEALAAVLRPTGGASEPCLLGALKTNIGHLEGAAGIAGLIKVALCLKNEAIPGNLHLDAVNPHLAEHLAGFVLPAVAQTWPRSARRRVAGVSAFGFGGTNAHVVLADAPLPAPEPPSQTVPTPLLLPVSARSDGALRPLADDYLTFLAGDGDNLPPADLAFTSAHRRLAHDYRLCAVGADAAEWAASLRQQLGEGRNAPRRADGEVAFVFSGQGGQRPEAGAQLLESEPVFRQAIEACDAALQRNASFSILDEMAAPAARSRLARADIGQPVQCALQIGLAALWRSWGIEPAAIIGHSLGEIAAAQAAGALSIADAMTVAVHRGQVLMDAAGLGGMAMVGLSADETATLIARHDPAISISAYNSPISCILSGPVGRLQALVADLSGRAVFARMLAPDYPSHSPLMDRFGAALEHALAGLSPSRPAIPIISTVTGLMSDANAFDAAYWARNLRQPVLFAPAIAALLQGGATTFLEIGPQPLLGMDIGQNETDGGEAVVVAGSLARDRPERQAMLEGAATLWRAGARLDWSKLAPLSGRCLALPRYRWERRSHWLPAARTAPRSMTAPDAVPTNWLYALEWQAAAPIADQPSSLATVDLAGLATALQPVVREFSPPHDAALRDWLDAASARYIVDALVALGADGSVGAIWALPSRLLPRYARLLQRMIDILVAQGVLALTAGGWRFDGFPSADDWKPSAGNKTEPGADLLMRCGPQLAGVLCGQVEPLDLLFARENGASAAAIYRDAAPSRRSNAVLQAAVRGWLSQLPAGQRIRILELGGGTGATTAAALPLLPPDRCDYVFTDVSPAFLHQAAEQFADYAFVRYDLLDLEQDVAMQGFATGAFDLVIAANVLHATADIRASLGRVHDLLADNGIVALIECTAARPWMDLTFGLTDGWWRFADADLRQTQPLLAAPQWVEQLRAHGFGDAVAVPLQGDDGDPLFDQALVCARRTRVTALPRRYLIVDQGCAVAAVLADRLRARGDACVVTHDATQAIAPDLHAVLYFAADQPGDLVAEGAALLSLAQGLLRAGAEPARGLWIVTQGCQPCGGVPASAPGQSLLWGLGRGISLEAPDIAPTLLDLDPDMDPALAATALLAELDHPTIEDQIVLRGDIRFIPRVRPLAPGALNAGAMHITGRHLITGGLGGIGSRLALELARAGASDLLLVVNRPLPDRAVWDEILPDDRDFHRIETVRMLEARGVTVAVAALDLRDEAALVRLFASPAITAGGLNGVWHMAMHVAPQELAEMTAENLATTIAVKARAALQLHELARPYAVQQFVLFSSTTGLWGARGFAQYAAANACLDALAHVRHAEGLPATVVNWGTWEIAERLSPDQQAQARRAGLKPMPAAAAFAALAQIVATERTQTIVADIDWGIFKPAYEARRPRPLLSEFTPLAPMENARALMSSPAEGDFLAQIKRCPPQDRGELVSTLVKRTLAAVLGLDPDGPIDRNRGFFELGMDSLTSVQLRRQLEAALGMRLATTVAFKYPTIEALSAHIGDVLFPAAPAVAAPVAAHPLSVPTPEREDASEDELFELLAGRLSANGTPS